MSRPELAVDVQFATRRPWVPSVARVAEWARAAAGRDGRGAELAVRIVGPRESRRLNHEWRGKDKATNVLSFPAGEKGSVPFFAEPKKGTDPFSRPEMGNVPISLGDLAICASVVAREAREQGKTLRAHWAHMVVHGVLHLLGLDHERDPAEARRMERRERTILARFGFADPYAVD